MKGWLAFEVYTTLRENKMTRVFLAIEKAYGSVWCNGIQYRLWGMSLSGEDGGMLENVFVILMLEEGEHR